MLGFKIEKEFLKKNQKKVIFLWTYIHYLIEASRGAGVQLCKRDWLWIRSPLGKKKYLFKFYISIFALIPRQKLGIEFHHSTHNALKNLAESGEQSVLTLRFLYLTYCVQLQPKAIQYAFYNVYISRYSIITIQTYMHT